MEMYATPKATPTFSILVRVCLKLVFGFSVGVAGGGGGEYTMLIE